MAGAIIRVAVLAGMTEVPVARIAGVAFAGFGRHQPSPQCAKRLNWIAANASFVTMTGRDVHESYESRLHS